MYRSILVPLDGSVVSEHALPLALSIAERADAALQVVHVHQPLAPLVSGVEAVPDWSLDGAVREQERAYLDNTVRKLAKVTLLPVKPVFLDGPPAQAIQEHAANSGTDLVVMTTHGRGPFTRFWLGSVADQLVRRLPIPILLLRSPEGAPNLESRPVLEHILIPLDGSELAEKIILPATELGALMSADYTLLSVVEPVLFAEPPLGGTAVGGLDPAVFDQLRAGAQTYLSQMAEKLKVRSLTVKTQVVCNQPAAMAILDRAENGIDLIALETHGRGGLARLLLGSVADKVVRGAGVAVLVHRPAGK